MSGLREGPVGNVWFTGEGSGAVQRGIQSKLRDSVSVKDFGAVGDGVADDTAAIQAALDYARTLVVETSASLSDPNYCNNGGVTVYMPAGEYLVTSTIDVPETVSLAGAGKYSTVILSSYDGQVVRNKVVAGDGQYDKFGIRLSKFCVKGDRTKTSQVLIDALRLTECRIDEVAVVASGGDGIKVRQGLINKLLDVTAVYCVGDGIVLDEGVVSWADTTASGYPSNANTLTNCHGIYNDGAGLRFKGRTNGNIVKGGSFEYNYKTAGDNSGYNAEGTDNNGPPNFLQA